MSAHSQNIDQLMTPCLSLPAYGVKEWGPGEGGVGEGDTTGPCKRAARDEQTIANRMSFFPGHRLVGLVVRRPPRERKIPGSNPA